MLASVFPIRNERNESEVLLDGPTNGEMEPNVSSIERQVGEGKFGRE